MATLGPINQHTTALYTSSPMLDENGAVVGVSNLDAAYLTLLNLSNHRAVVNGRNAQNCLNANGVTISAGGVITWVLDPADSGEAGLMEAVFDIRWGTTKRMQHPVTYSVLEVP